MVSRVFPAEMEYWDEILNFLDVYLEPMDGSEQMKDQVRISVEEIFTNIASYAYGEERGNVEIGCCAETEDTNVFRVSLKDWGYAYNPFERPDPSFDIPFEERRIGGLGIYMVKTFMDHVEYRYEDGCNIITIGKKL